MLLKGNVFWCKTYGGLEEVQSLGHAMLLHSGGNGPAARAELPSDWARSLLDHDAADGFSHWEKEEPLGNLVI